LDWFYEKLSQRIQKILWVIIALLVVILFGIMAFYSIQFITMGHQETAPGMKIRMSYVFFSMFILASSLTYFAILGLRQEFKNFQS
jgi:TRAP-type C4-dicarboxylate transport system permease small subunit